MNDSVVMSKFLDGVFTITLNRPDRMNAWNADVEVNLRDALVVAMRDPAVRIIVLTGSGKAFCAGADMEFLKDLRSGKLTVPAADQDDPWPDDTHEMFRGKFAIPAAVPKPVIAAINGPAVGIGFILSLFCDIRIGSDRASFIGSFSRLGLIAEKGIDWALSHIVGQGHAMEILLSGRKVGADEALKIGLLTSVIPHAVFHTAVQAYAAELAANISPRSAAVIKRQVQGVRFDDVATVLARGEVALGESLKSKDFREAMDALREKRTPEFDGL
uniref:Enoyl-CoA hydratase n=1 Tax=OCS116 cluster bacterium TaxID=2030921 RepID=A0A2A4Z1B7_9PROT